MSRRKPRGVNGPLKITTGQDPEFVSNELPSSKDDIEARILNLALAAAEAQKIALYDLTGEPRQNPENDFDFTLPTAKGTEYLDLVEIVLKGGYDGAPSSILVGDMADQLFAAVKKKAKKYGARRRSVIHLLLYSTHWKFLPSDSAIALLTLYCSRKQHGFKTLAVMVPIMDEAAMLWRCHPPVGAAGSMTNAQELQLRHRVLHQLSPFDAKQTPDGTGVGWTLPG